jgi:phosphoglycerate dehydrogenase-like enzyme
MNLLLTGAYSWTPEHLDRIKKVGYHVTFLQDERGQLNDDPEMFDAVVCNGLFQYHDITLFKNLKFIQLTSAGTDRVSLDHIINNGIKLYTARDVYSIPMSEWVVGKILEIYKSATDFYQAQQARKWEKNRNLIELGGKTAAIVGFGSVGTEVAKRLVAFGVSIIAVDVEQPRWGKVEWFKHYVPVSNISLALEQADMIILTLPLNNDTRQLINHEMLTVMKADSILVNVSRGEIVDETALISHLESGKFRGVALDVFEQEPLSANSPLWKFRNVLITPHNAFISDNIHKRFLNLVIKNLCEYYNNN